MDRARPWSTDRRERIVFLVLVILVLIDRVGLLLAFGLSYVGSDDLIFWQGATDYAHGVFHEPYFYGQNYDPMLEALLAVPLLWMGAHPAVALPVITSLMALFPFVLFAIVLHRHGRHKAALLFLLMPLLLPVEYGMLTSMSRGFVQGIFITGFLVFPLVRPHAVRSFVILALVGSFGYVLNPNSLILSVPVGLYLLLENMRRPVFHTTVLIGSMPALALQWAARAFYGTHPEYNVHWMWDLKFSFDEFLHGFEHMDRYFTHLMPVAWSFGWVFLLVLALVVVVLRRTEPRKAMAVAFALLFILALMGVNKVNDDVRTIFLSSVRIYIAAPLLLALAVAWLVPEGANNRAWGMAACGAGLCMVLIKMPLYRPLTEAHVRALPQGPVGVQRLRDVRTECSRLDSLARAHAVDLLVLVPFWEGGNPAMEFPDYACPLMEPGFPHTMLNVYERRTWVYQEELRSTRRNVLIMGRPTEWDTTVHVPGRTIERLDRITILVRGNSRPVSELLDELCIEVARNTY